MAERDKDNIGIDLNNLINNTIGSQKFRKVMGFYPKNDRTIFGNNNGNYSYGFILEVILLQLLI